MSPTEADRIALSHAEVTDQAPQGWRVVLDVLTARYDTGDFATGAAFVQGVAELADAADHHPDVDLRYPHVTLTLKSHDVGALTRRDVALARQVHDLATGRGVPVGQAPDRLELALDTPDQAEVGDFYAALLGYGSPEGFDDALVDPAGRGTPLWFQTSAMESSQRWHLDVWVPHDQAPARLAAVTEAGGELLYDGHAPAFWMLRDAQGNRSCLCTWQGRD